MTNGSNHDIRKSSDPRATQHSETITTGQPATNVSDRNRIRPTKRSSAPRVSALILLSISLGYCHMAWSATIERYISAGIEVSRWQEFSAADKRLLSENGPGLTLGASWENIPAHRGLRVNARTQLYSAILSYDGQTQSLDPNASGVYISSTSRYSGFSAELEMLFSLASPSLAGIVDIGADLWRRHIDDSSDAKGNSVSGFIENYQLLYSRFGLQKEVRDIYGRALFSIGISYPLKVNENASGISPTLHPGRAVSLFVACRLDLADRRRTSINIYYQGLRLTASPTVVDQYGNYWMQPRSRRDTVGVSIGIPF